MSTPCERIIPGQVDSDLYNEHVARYLFTKQFIKNKKVLDLGCGTGYGSKVMAEVAQKVVGADISSEAINYAKKHFNTTNISFHIEDCSRLGLADKSFDAVVSFEVIEHIKDYTGLVREAKRVLTDDGIFILSTPNKKYTEEKGETNPYHVHEFYYDEFDHLLKEFFGEVQILAENHCQGISISSPLCKKGYFHSSPNANESNSFETPSYFIAVCYQHPKSVPEIKRLFYIPREANILREKEIHIKALQEQLKEFDERTKWALKLDAELTEKGKLLGELQHELEERSRWALQLDSKLQEINKKSKLKQALDERTKLASKLDAELKEKDKYLSKLQAEFDEKTGWATQLDLKLKESNQALSNLRQELDERSKWALKLDAELKEKDAYIKKLQKEFDDHTKWVLKLDAELKEKDKYLGKLQHEFDEKARWTSQLNTELKESNRDLLELRQEYDERTSWALKLDTELKERNDYIGRLQHEFDERTKSISKLDAEIKDKTALLHTINQLLQEKDQIIIQLQEDIKKKTNSLTELQKELQSLKNTKLYKLGKKTRLI